jgi:hypothetical protein
MKLTPRFDLDIEYTPQEAGRSFADWITLTPSDPNHPAVTIAVECYTDRDTPYLEPEEIVFFRRGSQQESTTQRVSVVFEAEGNNRVQFVAREGKISVFEITCALDKVGSDKRGKLELRAGSGQHRLSLPYTFIQIP